MGRAALGARGVVRATWGFGFVAEGETTIGGKGCTPPDASWACAQSFPADTPAETSTITIKRARIGPDPAAHFPKRTSVHTAIIQKGLRLALHQCVSPVRDSFGLESGIFPEPSYS
jgi:hypothetical protein